MKNIRNSGFIQIIIILLVLALVAGAYYFGTKNKSVPTPSLVASVPPSPSPTTSQAPNGDLANLKTYISNVYGFRLNYPGAWVTYAYGYKPQDDPKDTSQRFFGPEAGWQVQLEISNKETTDLEALKNSVNDYSWTNKKSSNSTISGILGFKYTGIDQGNSQEVVIFANDKYVFQFSGTPSSGFDQILSTFKFTTDISTTFPTPTIPPNWIVNIFSKYNLKIYTPNDWQSSITDYPETSSSLIRFWKRSSPAIVPIQLDIKSNWDNSGYDPSQAKHVIVGENISAIRIDPPTKAQQVLDRYQTNVYFEHNTKIYVFECVHNWVQDYLDTCNTMLDTLKFN